MICTEYAATITKFGRTNVVGNIQEDPYLRSTYWIAKTQLGQHISPVVLRYTNHRGVKLWRDILHFLTSLGNVEYYTDRISIFDSRYHARSFS